MKYSQKDVKQGGGTNHNIPHDLYQNIAIKHRHPSIREHAKFDDLINTFAPRCDYLMQF